MNADRARAFRAAHRELDDARGTLQQLRTEQDLRAAEDGKALLLRDDDAWDVAIGAINTLAQRLLANAGLEAIHDARSRE